MVGPRRLTELSRRLDAAADLPTGRLVVALSGGADSAALAWYLVDRGHPVRALHIHHGWAGSDRLERAAIDIAGTLGLEFDTVRVEVATGASPEARAREARYAAFGQSLVDDEWLLTAHTSDDQAETVVERLLRGAGPDGLTGIPPRRPPFARPFLAVDRATTREVATLAGLRYVDDPMNDDPSVLRVRIRQRLIPTLEAEYHPNLRQAINTSAALVAVDSEFLDSRLPPVTTNNSSVSLAASVISTAPSALGGRMARRLLEAAGVDSAGVSAVESVLAVAAGTASRASLPGGRHVERSGALVVISTSIDAPAATELEVPGRTIFGGWTFESVVSADCPVMPLAQHVMVADPTVLGSLRIVPAESVGSIALDPLAMAGVPSNGRPRHPVITSGHQPVWIPGVSRFPVGWASVASDRYLVVRTRTDGYV